MHDKFSKTKYFFQKDRKWTACGEILCEKRAFQHKKGIKKRGEFA
jgi:hypothetical protein